MNAKTELRDLIIASLRDEPRKWVWDSGRDTWIEHSCGLKLWVWFGAMYVWKPTEIKFKIFDRVRLRRAFRQWVRVHGRGLILQEQNQAIAWAVMALTKARRVS